MPKVDKTTIIPFKDLDRPKWNVGWLPDNEVLCGIFGASGSGKTHYLRKLIPMIAPKYVKYINIATRIPNNKVYDTIHEYCDQHKILYSKTTELKDTMDQIETIINDKKDEEHAILIFDDFNAGGITDRSDPYAKISNEAFLKLRNYNCHMVYIVQSFSGMSAIARTNLNCFIIFRNTGANARRMLATDFEKLTNHKIEEFETLHSSISKIKHSYFMFTGDQVLIHLHDKMNEFEERPIKF
jgi:ABC-type dipeptide/oligopeptide/nickel transport system ATPase component